VNSKETHTHTHTKESTFKSDVREISCGVVWWMKLSKNRDKKFVFVSGVELPNFAARLSVLEDLKIF
jgi:hypothetical protein